MSRPIAGDGGSLPVIDMTPLFGDDRAARGAVARWIEAACRDSGFFYVAGHGVAEATIRDLESVSRRFFALPHEAKMAIAMARGGAAWRGFFPVGGELTSGRPDIKEGLYFGSELPADHPRVVAGWPLHGANLWPPQVPELRAAVERYMAEATRAGHALIEGVALALGLEADYFQRHYTAEPTILFRIFHYPVPSPNDAQSRDAEARDAPSRDAESRDAQSRDAEPRDAESWGVGEHSDYGLLTMLAQDASGGLQVKTPPRTHQGTERGGWIEAPPLPGTLVCNIGDMLDRLTGGWFRSTPHRVRNSSGRGRLSFPLFFDPDFAAEMRPLPRQARVPVAARGQAPGEARWDGADLQAFAGSYGDYLLGKVSKVFPELRRQVL